MAYIEWREKTRTRTTKWTLKKAWTLEERTKRGPNDKDDRQNASTRTTLQWKTQRDDDEARRRRREAEASDWWLIGKEGNTGRPPRCLTILTARR